VAGVRYPEPKSSSVTAVMKGNKRVDTRPERLLRSALHAWGCRFRKDYRIRTWNEMWVRPDIAFTRRRVAVFVDGCFWHGCPEHGRRPSHNEDYWIPKLENNQIRDQAQTAALEEMGWTVLRIWEHVPVASALELVLATLRRTD
jgi:DNA mismatch endonuclease (patch repair protein)